MPQARNREPQESTPPACNPQGSRERGQGGIGWPVAITMLLILASLESGPPETPHAPYRETEDPAGVTFCYGTQRVICQDITLTQLAARGNVPGSYADR